MPNLYLPSRRVEVSYRLGALGAAFDALPAEIAVDTLESVLVGMDFVQGGAAGAFPEMRVQGQSSASGTWRDVAIEDLTPTYGASGITTTSDAHIYAFAGPNPPATPRDFNLAFPLDVSRFRALRIAFRAVNGGAGTTLAVTVAGNR